jgi:hypothetical protein
MHHPDDCIAGEVIWSDRQMRTTINDEEAVDNLLGTLLKYVKPSLQYCKNMLRLVAEHCSLFDAIFIFRLFNGI